MAKQELEEPKKVIIMKEEKNGEIKIQELPGVGAATAEKLGEAGYDDLISVAVTSPGQLVDAAGVTE